MSTYGNAPVAHYREGLDAAKPAPDTVPPGSMWFSTDTGVLSVSNGSTTWRNVAPSASGGGSSPVVRKFPFAFNSPNILTGHTVYVPTIGDILLDAWLEIDTAWNGVTPLGDIGVFLDGPNQGWFQWIGNLGPIDLTMAETIANVVGLQQATASGTDLAQTWDFGPDGISHNRRPIPAKFSTADPIKVVVSQDGKNNGANPGSTQGAAVLYLVTVTPV